MGTPRLTPVRQSLSRPMLFMGAERELVIMSGVIAVVLIFAVGGMPALLGGIVLWVISVAVLQRMAKYDPQLSRVYIRHANKRLFYPANPTFAAPARDVAKHQ